MTNTEKTNDVKQFGSAFIIAQVYQYIAFGVAIAEALYVVTAFFRRECSVVFTTMLSMIILCLVYAHFHA